LVLAFAIAVVPSQSPAAEMVRFKKVSVMDRKDMIGGEAFSFLMPVGWTVDGGIVWRVHPAMPAALNMRVRNPQGLEQLEVFPTMGYTYGPYMGPVGSKHFGNEVRPPFKNALHYLKTHLIRQRKGARITAEEDLPMLADAVAKSEQAVPSMQYTAGRVRIEYDVKGKPVEEDLFCVLMNLSMQGGMTIQMADKLVGMRSAKGRLDEQTKIYQTMIFSTRPNLKWFNKYAQLCQSLSRAQIQRIKAVGEFSRMLSKTSSEIRESMQRTYEDRQASQDRINKNWSQYMRGVDEYFDPLEKRAVELPSGYGKAWVNNRGEYVVTDSSLFNPNVELGGDWRQLKKSGN